MITFQPTVHDGCVSLLGDALLGNLGINPVREAPHVGSNLAELDVGRRVVSDDLLEVIVEVAVVEKDVGVVIPAVEVALDRLDGLDDAIQLLVSGEDDERGIGAGRAGIRVEATSHEDLVVLFADFAVRGNRVSGGSRVGKTRGLGQYEPDRRRRTSRHEYPTRRARMPDEQNQNQNDDEERKDDDDAERYGDGRVAAQAQRPTEKCKLRGEALSLR